MRLIIFSDHDEAAGFFIETMDDAGPEFSSYSREGREVMQQGVDQRSTIALIVGGAGASVHHHACRLVDDRQIIILVQDVERNLFRNGT